MAGKSIETDPTTAYARAVLSGEILAGRLVRLACERHLRDLDTGAARGLHFDTAAAERVFKFFGQLRLSADVPFKLQPFQQFILGSLFGWKKADGTRRFRSCYSEQGKGNGKSPLAAGIGLYGLVADDEPSPEIYAAATKKDQAMILFRDAANIFRHTPGLTKRLKPSGTFPSVWNLSYEKAAGFFRPISSEDKGQSGPRPHFGLIDELHEHRTAVVVDMMRAGFKNRKNPLLFEITNSGFDRQSVCWEHREYSEKVLTGQIEDDTWFSYVCTLDACAKCMREGRTQPVDGCPDCDHWDDETVWLKANPGLDTILKRSYLREQVHEAKGMPSREGVVKRLNFCLWTERVTVWIPADVWKDAARKVDRAALAGRQCFGALDLANRFDLNAFVLTFPEALAGPPPAEGERVPEGAPKTHATFTLLPFFWMPEQAVAEREKADKVPYALWIERGFIKVTPGNVTDYSVIETDLQALGVEFSIAAAAYDPHEATQLATQLLAYGLPMVEFHQTIANYNEPTKEFEALLRAKKMYHGDNPVLNWMAGNAAVIRDRQNRMRPVKPGRKTTDGQWIADETKKVDGIQAAVMALGVAMANPVQQMGFEWS